MEKILLIAANRGACLTALVAWRPWGTWRCRSPPEAADRRGLKRSRPGCRHPTSTARTARSDRTVGAAPSRNSDDRKIASSWRTRPAMVRKTRREPPSGQGARSEALSGKPPYRAGVVVPPAR